MSGDPGLVAVRPVLSYPRRARAGETYLLTIDLRGEDGVPWPYQQEEYVVYCLLQTLPLFEHRALGSGGVVLHRYGGTYGPAQFLLRACDVEQSGTIRVTLVNGWGVPVSTLNLPGIRVGRGTEFAADPSVRRLSLRWEGFDLRVMSGLNDVSGSAPALALNGDDRLEIFVRGNDGALWHLWQEQRGGAWSKDWVSRGSARGGFAGAPALALNGDDRLELFVRGNDGALWHLWQEQRGGAWSKDWVSRGRAPGGFAGSPALALNGDDRGRRLELFVRGVDGALWHLWQEQRGGAWSKDWVYAARARAGFAGSPALALNGDDRLELFVRGVDGALWHLWQEQRGGTWSKDWVSRGSAPGGFAGSPALALNGDDRGRRLELFVRGNDGALWHLWQEQRGGAWSKNWVSPGRARAVFAGSPALALNGDDRLELFVRGVDGTLWHLWQEQRGGTWSKWLTHGRPGGGFTEPDLQLMSWGDGSGVPTSGQNLVIAGLDHKGLLHIRTFDAAGVRIDTFEATDSSGALDLESTDASGKVLSDEPESSLPAAQSSAIATLKQQLSGWLLPHVQSGAEREQVLSEMTSIIGHIRFASAPALTLNGEGRLELFVRGVDGALWYLWQEQRGGAWSIWLAYGGFDLRLMSALNNVSGIPTEGKNLIIVAAVNHVIHFRIFDGDGKLVVDTDEKSLADQSQPIEDLRKHLESLWPPHEITRIEKGQVVTTVTSIIDHTRRTPDDEIPASTEETPVATAPDTPGRAQPVGDRIQAPMFSLPFDKDGLCLDPPAWKAVTTEFARGGYTDLFLLTHGWNMDWRDATAFCERFFTGFLTLNERTGPSSRPFRPLLAGALWESAAFAASWETQSGSVATAEEDSGVDQEELKAIASDLREEDAARLSELAGRQGELKREEVLELARILTPLYQDLEHSQGPEMSPAELVERWEQQRLPSGGLFSGVFQAARNTLRTASFWQMLERAGRTGALGLSPILRDLLDAGTGTRLHLVAHSFGARLMLSALCEAPLPRQVDSVVLLQPAVSYLCFARDLTGEGKPGEYRTALDRVALPIMTTYSRHDTGLNLTYRLAMQVARPSNLRDVRIEVDPHGPYAALGGVGPRGCEDECRFAEMILPPERYDLQRQSRIRLIALDGQRYINDHDDISNEATWWLLCNLVLPESPS